MKNISRKIAAFTLAGALTLPTTAGVAQAQSSFGSSSADNEYTENTGSKSNRLERAVEEALVNAGQTIGKTAEARSEALLQRAIDNDLVFVDNLYEEVGYNPFSQSTVMRLTPTEMEYVLVRIASEEFSFDDYLPEYEGVSIPFGVSVGKNSDYYYLVMSFTIG